MNKCQQQYETTPVDNNIHWH